MLGRSVLPGHQRWGWQSSPPPRRIRTTAQVAQAHVGGPRCCRRGCNEPAAGVDRRRSRSFRRDPVDTRELGPIPPDPGAVPCCGLSCRVMSIFGSCEPNGVEAITHG